MILLLVVLKDCLNAALTCHLQHQLSESHWSQVPLLMWEMCMVMPPAYNQTGQ
jgi:hypothetical protein